MVKIYHNPRCSKSRQALEILKSNVDNVEIIEYLKTGFSKQEIEDLLKKLNNSAKDIVRKKEIKEIGIDLNNISDDNLIQAMVENPKIIERPIVITDKGACIARPPEKLTEIL